MWEYVGLSLVCVCVWVCIPFSWGHKSPHEPRAFKSERGRFTQKRNSSVQIALQFKWTMQSNGITGLCEGRRRRRCPEVTDCDTIKDSQLTTAMIKAVKKKKTQQAKDWLHSSEPSNTTSASLTSQTHSLSPVFPQLSIHTHTYIYKKNTLNQLAVDWCESLWLIQYASSFQISST